MRLTPTIRKTMSLAAIAVALALAAPGDARSEITGTWPENVFQDQALPPITFFDAGGGRITGDFVNGRVQGELGRDGTQFDFIFIAPTGQQVGQGRLQFAQTGTREQWMGYFDFTTENMTEHGAISSIRRMTWRLVRERRDDGAGGSAGGAGGGIGEGPFGGAGDWGGGYTPSQQGDFTPWQGDFGNRYGKTRRNQPHPPLPPIPQTPPQQSR